MHKRFKMLLGVERSPTKLAWSCCLGIGVALSPFLGLQTWIAIALSWLLRLNTKVVIIVLYLVNNPLTMIPIIIADYAVGYFIFQRLLHINLVDYNPSLVLWLERKIGPYLCKYLGVNQICFWEYILGGTLLAVIGALVCYPLLKWYFTNKLKGDSQ